MDNKQEVKRASEREPKRGDKIVVERGPAAAAAISVLCAPGQHEAAAADSDDDAESKIGSIKSNQMIGEAILVAHFRLPRGCGAPRLGAALWPIVGGGANALARSHTLV